MTRNLLFLVVLCAFSVASAWAQPGQSLLNRNKKVVNPLVLYDDFKGPLIDLAKWNNWVEPGQMLEAVRELSPSNPGEGSSRRLHIFERAYSTTYNGDSDVTHGWLGLQFTHPDAITEVSFNVMVSRAAISGCQSNSSSAGVGAEFRGRFFNAGGSDGDVEAVVSLYAPDTNARAPLIANAHYYTLSGFLDARVLGFVPFGQTAKLPLKWDQPNHQFIFQLNDDPEVSLAYNLADDYPPSAQIKTLQVTTTLPNCATTPPGSEMMDAYFDNVYVNSQ